MNWIFFKTEKHNGEIVAWACGLLTKKSATEFICSDLTYFFTRNPDYAICKIRTQETATFYHEGKSHIEYFATQEEALSKLKTQCILAQL